MTAWRTAAGHSAMPCSRCGRHRGSVPILGMLNRPWTRWLWPSSSHHRQVIHLSECRLKSYLDANNTGIGYQALDDCCHRRPRPWVVQKEREPTNAAGNSANAGDLHPPGMPWFLQAIVVCCNQSWLIPNHEPGGVFRPGVELYSRL